MRHPERTRPLERMNGHGRFVILAALVAFCMWMPVQAGAQLPSLINLNVPLGQEVSPVYRIFGDNAGEALGGGGGDPSTPSGQVALGDFDGDGFADVIAGIPLATTSVASTSGGAYILYGGSGLPGSYLDLNTDGIVTAANETRILGGGMNFIAGYAVAAGDVNGDGFDDAIVTEPGVDASNPGRVRVVYGSPGLRGAVVNLSDSPTAVGIATTEIVGTLDNPGGAPTSSLFGRAAASGDVNGDGFDDVVVGAYATDTLGGTDTGAVFVVFGGASLPGTTITASTTAGAGVSSILGDDTGDRFGWSVGCGDVNGDGHDDVIAGAPYGNPQGRTDAGEVHVLYGQAVWPSTLDLNTTSDAISAASETRILGDDGSSTNVSPDNFGWSVSSGDVNGDGFHEVIVGAYLATPLSRTRAGEAYVFYGKATLPGTVLNMNTTPSESISPAGETRMLGATALDGTGFSVGAGDADGDGRADVLAGAWQTASGTQPGRIFLLRSANLPASANVDLAAFSSMTEVRGAATLDWFGSSAFLGADLDRDGFGDLAGSAPGGDNPFLTPASSNNAGYAAVVFGDGVSATATATTSFAAGATPLKGLGGRLAPGVRAWVSFDDGAAGKATGILTRNANGVSGIPEATPVDVAQVLWQLSTTRTGWTSAHAVLRYTDSEVAGLDETKLVLYQAASKSGPWTALTAATHNAEHNAQRNEFSVDVSSLGYFALAADTVGPALSISPPSVDLTRDAPVSYTVTYTRAATITLSADDVDLVTTGSANATVSVDVLGDDTRSVTLSDLTGDGTIAISIAADTARDASENPTPAAGPSVAFRVDHTPPEVTIGEPSVTGTASGPVTYTVSYAGASAISLSPADVELVAGLVSADIEVSGDPESTVRTVTLSNISGDGTAAIRLAAGTASDEVGNLAPQAGPATVFTVDNTPPTVNIGSPSLGATRSGPVTFAVTYGGAASIALSGKVTLNRTGTANGTVAVTATGANSRLVTISNIAGDGTLGISVQAGSATDTVGNTAPAAGPSETFTVDNTGPALVIGPPSVTSTETDPVSFLITYTDASNISLTPGNVTLIATGTATGTVTIQGSGTTDRTVVIDNISGDGTLGISLVPGTASDAVGNLAPEAGPSANVAVGSVDLAVSIGAPNVSLTRGGPVSFTITYTGADEVTLQDADVIINTTGTVAGTASVQGTGVTQRTVVVSGLTGDGIFTISLAAGTASNSLGDTAQPVGTSATVTVDNTAPTVSIGAPSVTATQSGPVTFEVEYQGADVVALSTDDIELIETGNATADVDVSGSGIGPRTVTLSNITGAGTLAISVGSGTALDAVGNSAAGAGPSAAVTVDNAGPTVAIGAPSATTTATGPVSFTVTYTGATAITLGPENVQFEATGSVTGTVTVTGSGAAERTVVVSNIAGTGTFTVSIDAGTATDALGNLAGDAGPSAVVTVQDVTFNAADVNRDTKLNATDVQLVINAALGKPIVGFPDVNGDNKVNATDVQRVINGVLGRV